MWSWDGKGWFLRWVVYWVGVVEGDEEFVEGLEGLCGFVVTVCRVGGWGGLL